MPLPASALSIVCRSIADFVSEGLRAPEHTIRVMIGNPADAVPKPTDSEHRINLFFYRLEPFGFAPDGGSDETWWLRLHCLVTAFGISESLISAGENDLRLLGELIRLFHESPVRSTEVNGETVELQVVFHPLSTDDINHLWSTQGDVSYRTSVAYEMAVVPIFPRARRIPSPVVGATGFAVGADMQRRYAEYNGVLATPPVHLTQVEISRPDWVPHIAFVHERQCAYTLAFERGSDALRDFVPNVWVAGAPGAEVHLYWDIWHRDSGWETLTQTWQVTVDTDRIDPAASDTAHLATILLPQPERDGQAMLYAVHEYTPAGGGATAAIRSNPLLVTIYTAA